MVEILMFFALGFLTAILLLLAVIPVVHARAERLVIQRLEASMPISIAEVHASKDILRAEFAMSTRRLERTIEQLRSKTMAYARELGQRTVIVTQPQPELMSGTIGQGADAPHLNGEKSSVAADAPPPAEDILVTKESEMAELRRELDERARTSDAQRVELVTLKIQLDALKRQLSDIRQQQVQEQAGLAKRREGLRLAG